MCLNHAAEIGSRLLDTSIWMLLISKQSSRNTGSADVRKTTQVTTVSNPNSCLAETAVGIM